MAKFDDEWASDVEQLTEEANCVEEGTYRACDLVDKKTGQVKDSMWFSGGTRLTEGDFVPPDKWHFTVSSAKTIGAGRHHLGDSLIASGLWALALWTLEKKKVSMPTPSCI